MGGDSPRSRSQGVRETDRNEGTEDYAPPTMNRLTERPETWLVAAGLVGVGYLIAPTTFLFFSAVGCFVLGCSLVVIGRRKSRNQDS